MYSYYNFTPSWSVKNEKWLKVGEEIFYIRISSIEALESAGANLTIVHTENWQYEVCAPIEKVAEVMDISELVEK